MMKRLILAAVSALAFGTAAQAADLPSSKVPPPAPIAAIPSFTWTGFYVGVNGGGAWAGSNNNSYVLYDPKPDTGDTTPSLYSSGGNRSGWLIGGTVGYNYQFGAGSGFVIGVEGDIDYLSNNNKNRSAYLNCPVASCGVVGGIGADGNGYAGTYVGLASGSGNNYFGTIRARLGWAFDHFLIYATGGFAFGGAGNSGTATLSYWAPTRYAAGTSPDATWYVGRSGSDDWGWTIGGGAEYAITNNWTVKAEYLYVNRTGGNNNGAFAGCAGSAVVCNAFSGTNALIWYANAKNDQNMNVVRLGVNYKF
jgi:outer membrane immunogenic protein